MHVLVHSCVLTAFLSVSVSVAISRFCVGGQTVGRSGVRFAR